MTERVPVFILAGGRGERLAGVVDQPKPLVEVGGRPFAALLVDRLAREGFRRIFFLTGYRGEAFEPFLEAMRRSLPETLARWGRPGPAPELRCLREATPLGTGGALRGALPHVERTALILNGDTFCDLDHRALLALHAATGGAFCLTAAQMPDAADYGTLALDDDGRMTALREKGAGGPGWVNAGVYAVPRAFLEAIPEGSPSLERDLLPAWLSRAPVWAYRVAGGFHDIGTPERLERARRELPPPAEGV
jgi:NDP-sugar pyrophosphorylase family protein